MTSKNINSYIFLLNRKKNSIRLFKELAMRGYMYILECCDGSYYTGSSINLERRLKQHQAGEGANHTMKRLPVRLVYVEEYPRIYLAYKRERQVHGWRRAKKVALIKGHFDRLPELAIAYRDLPGSQRKS
jgi:putative endonuclease